MAAKKREYKRLSGTGMKMASRSKLWLGADHLLAVTSTGYWENYKRFYLRDIQAFIIRPNRRGRIANIILAVLAFLPLLGAVSVALGGNPDFGLAVFWGIIAGLLLVCLIVNTVRGPTCMVYVKTAVQMEELPSLRRVWRAHKLLNFLQPLLTGAQGEFTSAEAAPSPKEPGSPLTPTLSPPRGEGEERAGSAVESAKSPGDSAAAVEPVEPQPPAAT